MEDIVKVCFYITIMSAVYYLLPYILGIFAIVAIGFGIFAILPCDNFKDRLLGPWRERYLRNKYEGKHVKK